MPQQDVRLNLRTTPDTYERIERVAEEAGLSKSELIRRALGAFEYILTLQRQGKHVGVAKAGSDLEKEFVFL